MAYSSLFTNKQKKIPLIGVVFVLIVSIFILSGLFRSPPPPSRANIQLVKDIQVVNVGATRADITWTTDTAKVGWIVYGETESELTKTALDARDAQDVRGSYKNHYVPLQDLKEQTTYYFKIVDSKQIVGDGSNKPYRFQTTKDVTEVSWAKPAYGKVIGKNGQPATNVFVYLKPKDAKELFAMTKESGEWLISLSAVYNEKGKQLYLQGSDPVTIEMKNENGETSTVQATVGSLSPVPQTIVLGNTYVINEQGSVLAATDEKKDTADSSSFSILYPRSAAVIPGNNPLIKGTAKPGSIVELTIDNSSTRSVKVTTDTNGVWTLTGKVIIPAGPHTLTAISKGDGGKQILITRNFTIAKSGEQVVLGEATGEATPTLIPATTVPTTILTSVPTSVATASAYPTVIPSTPVTGPNALPLIAGSGLLILVGLGLLVAF